MKKTIFAMAVAAVVLTGCGENRKEPASGPANETAEDTRANAPNNTGATPPDNTASPEPADAKYKGEQIGQALLDGEYDEVYGQLSKDFQQELTSAQFRETLKSFNEGVESWEQQSRRLLNDWQYYTWIDPVGKKKGLKVIMDKKEEITGLRAMPLESFPETDAAQTQLAYDLPFKGEWYVFWGGENVLVNYHYELESQRYAYDIVQIKDGYSYKGDAKKNESYYAFGQELIAPQDGKVVHVVNDIKDNEPVGVMNAEQPLGNVVVIDHGNGEFSFLAHMKKGSAVVKVGDQVSQGDPIGQCGNSGNSSEPHLHYQVSDKQDLFDGKSIRVQWKGGLSLPQGETVKG
ncbi:peptidoglycan DD-metalloendopeptidase family protein [Paenibacillus nasutitermitis]|uniref:Peptidase M23 n=1 Tax=Paenibacillus nasutitermitis TaxID=1652958 RepID=A0A917DLE8_9BACL|nr:peptidoglycan DD-metalloendopeptidase family protein [Paenibacillus nasutitermitis]GGD47541.1 peptidase M23 [Paenibacillus nasutitermitis]